MLAHRYLQLYMGKNDAKFNIKDKQTRQHVVAGGVGL